MKLKFCKYLLERVGSRVIMNAIQMFYTLLFCIKMKWSYGYSFLISYWVFRACHIEYWELIICACTWVHIEYLNSYWVLRAHIWARIRAHIEYLNSHIEYWELMLELVLSIWARIVSIKSSYLSLYLSSYQVFELVLSIWARILRACIWVCILVYQNSLATLYCFTDETIKDWHFRCVCMQTM